MKILFVSINPLEYNTSATIQNRGIIVGLCENGHSVDTLTLELNKENLAYDESLEDINKYVCKKYFLKLSNSYNAMSAKKSGNDSQGFKSKVKIVLKRIYNAFKIYDGQAINIRNLSNVDVRLNEYDLILSCSDPKSSHLLVLRLIKHQGLKNYRWIQYWGDPMLNDITRKKSAFDFLVRREEKRLICAGSKIVYATEFTEEVQKNEYKEFSDKIFSVNLAYNNLITFEKNVPIDGIIKLGYFGAYHSSIRNILNLYNVCVKEKFNLTIAGDSDLELKSENNVKVFGKINYSDVLDMENKSNILVCLLNNKGTQIPGKIFYLSSYNKPIIIILDGDYKDKIRKNLEQYGRFILCNNEEADILSAINEGIIQLNKDVLTPVKMSPFDVANRIIS